MLKLEDVFDFVPWYICCRCGRKYKNGDTWKYICLSCRKELKLHTKPQEERYLVWHVIRKYGRKSFGRKNHEQ